MKKEDEARILAAAFENELKKIRRKFGISIKKNLKALEENLQPLKEKDERVEIGVTYKNILGDALYLAAYDQAETLYEYTNRIADYLKIEKFLEKYDTWKMKEKLRSEVTNEFDMAIDEIDHMVEGLPFY